jgi:ketosteroid isomerase-like protein
MSLKGSITMRAVAIPLGVMLAAICVDCAAATTNNTCMESSTNRDGAVAAAGELFAALRTDDLDRFRKIVSPDFYAFDAGRRFDGSELALFVKEAHAKGTHFTWSITEPQVHMSCGTAWLTYVNKGSVGTAAGEKPLSWLESMVLQYRDSQWRISFLHSTPVPDLK